MQIPSLTRELPLAALILVPWSSGDDACETTSRAARNACREAASSELWLRLGACANLGDPREVLECRLEAFEDFESAQEECQEQFVARAQVCRALGGGPYDPEIDPGDFVSGVTNRFFRLLPNTTKIFEKLTREGLERIEVTVLEERKEILGVSCTVVRDAVTLDGELVDIGGSWKAGVDDAKPGVVMLADPEVGDAYRQEFLLGEAEDVALVVEVDAAASVVYGSFTGCLVTEDFTPLEPGTRELKTYAPGLGVVLEVDPETGERLELVDVLVH